MESPAKKKGKMIQEFQDEVDNISRLPNELIHKILSSTDAKEADLPDSCLTCLPALTTLCLEDWDFSKYFSFSLPKLTTLCLSGADRLPETVWNFPCLLSLDLDVDLPENVNHILSTLVNLQNLKITLREVFRKHDLFISCPQLLNLNLMISSSVPPTYSIVGWFKHMKREDRERYYLRLPNMLLGVGSAKNISFDLDSIEVLSAISDFLASVPSPFCKVEYVKLPQEYKESSISGAVRSYLLGGSPKATIVASLLQNNMIPQTAAVTATAENAGIQEPLAAPTKELVDRQYINKALSVHTVDMRVQEQHVVKNLLVDADRFKKVDSPVEGTSNDLVSSTKGNKEFGLWQGHEVNSEFVCLLDLIMHKYPETFEHFSMKNKKLCTLRLNTLCSSLNAFTKIPMTEVDSEIIVEYRDRFTFLQGMGFNLSWVVTRLNYIQHLRFSKPLITELHAIDCHIDDAKTKVQDLQAQVDDAKNILQNLQTLRSEKMSEIQKDFGTMGTSLAVGFIGDDLLSSL
ncbi:hypothetical protein POM88_039733 [Heracleum sosnowskyi]|uniref:F-box domain-containing protein n=1 Tax=Heracleum sosnowskyi TaxID=360622 RepID=A0AAD8M943_9APIA|nr:hypothetical protein POM88_039733 [Heracleum sosnowskyi]